MTQQVQRIFISHSAHAKEEPSTQEFLDRLVERINASPGLETLVDQRDLRAGDEWVQRLYSWMGICDTAVILLSPRAITRENSSWVPREVNILLWRKALDPSFLVIPVLIGGLKKSTIGTNPFIGNVGLEDLQFACGDSDEDKLDEIVLALNAQLVKGARSRAFTPLQVYVEDSITRFAPGINVEYALAHFYGQDTWLPYAKPSSDLALKMVQSAGSIAIDEVINQVATGSQPGYNLGTTLFGALFPMRLPAEFACRLLTLCRQQEGRGPILVNATTTWAVRMLLRASTGLPQNEWRRKWIVVELLDGWGDDDEREAIHSLAHELAEAMLGTGGWELLSNDPDPLASLHEQLVEWRDETKTPILVCARFSARWAELIPLLSSRFPTCAFLLCSGDKMPALGSYGADCVPLDPSWDPGMDKRWERDYKRKLTQYGGGSV